MTNTEKPTTKAENKKQGIVNTPNPQRELSKAPINTSKEETPIKKPEEPKTEKENKEQEKKEQEPDKSKKEPKKTEKLKKTEAVVNAKNLPVSTLHSIAICKFIKGKGIQVAIKNLEEVLTLKRPVPMKGEIPHRKGKIMSGGYPKKASEHFIKLLKNLQANANANGLEKPVIAEAISNIGYRPYGRFGSVRRKRTNIKIKAKEKKLTKKNKKKK